MYQLSLNQLKHTLTFDCNTLTIHSQYQFIWSGKRAATFLELKGRQNKYVTPTKGLNNWIMSGLRNVLFVPVCF